MFKLLFRSVEPKENFLKINKDLKFTVPILIIFIIFFYFKKITSVSAYFFLFSQLFYSFMLYFSSKQMFNITDENVCMNAYKNAKRFNLFYIITASIITFILIEKNIKFYY